MVTKGADVSHELFTVLSLAAGTGCLATLFVAAHLSWVEKRRRRAWKPSSSDDMSDERDHRCGGLEVSA